MRAAKAPRRNPRQERSRITVNAIVESAARVFAARGYAAATTNRIAGQAGVSVGSVYQYFPDKLALLRAVHERNHETLMHRMNVACNEPAESLAAALRAMIAAAFEHHRANAALERVFACHLPGGTQPAAAATRQFRASLSALLQSHRAELRVASVEEGMFLVSNLARSVMHAAVTEREGDLAGSEIADGLLAGVVAVLTHGPVTAGGGAKSRPIR